MTQLYLPSSEELGRRRFHDAKSDRRLVKNLAEQRLIEMRTLLPSNYPKDPYNSNLALYHRFNARELARIKVSNDDIGRDAQYITTRPEYLHQILGERLFLGNKIAPTNYNDETYREFLVAIKNTYLRGSKVEDIEALASQFTGQEVIIKELYRELRKADTSLDVSDTNMMVVEALINGSLPSGYNIESLLNDLNFYINLVRPAHVLYDTRLIWTETIDVNKTIGVYFGDTGGGCIPLYLYDPFDETTLMALQIFILPTSEGATGLIDSIHHWDSLFYLDDSTRVLTEPGTQGTRIFDKNGRQVTFSTLEIGQYVKISYQIIPGNFQFWWYPEGYFPTWSSQFYKDYYRRPIFQEFVKKEMDSQGRFPLQIRTTSTTICDRWVQDTLQPYYEDLRTNCSSGSVHAKGYSVTLNERMGSTHFANPYGTNQTALPGNEFAFFMEQIPLTDGSSNPATVSDVMVMLDGTSLPLQPVVYVDASSGKVQLSEDHEYWDSTALTFSIPGEEFQFDYHYLLDSTNYDSSSIMVYGVGSWQMPSSPLVSGDSSGVLADTSDVTLSVDGTTITNAITDLNALLGHLTVNQLSSFWNSSELGRLPQVGDEFEFDFHYGLKYQYSCLFDELGRTFDTYIGPNSTYGILFDGELNGDPEVIPIAPDSTAVIGYRYRGYLLHHSSVLNSSDTLQLNTFQKPATRASIINQANTINHFNIFFSPEFLYDTSTISVLDDAYLENGLEPILKLNKGTPTFQQTWSYQPGLVYNRKLQDIRTNHRLLLYSDLLLKKFQEGNDEIPLSSICDSGRLDFRIRFDGDIISPLEECPPWILFDSVQVDEVEVSVPGFYKGVPNVRVPGKNLREDFILRELEATGVAEYTYIFNTDSSATSEYYLPASFPYTFNDDGINFPALPIVDIDGNIATISDIEVRVNGVLWTVLSFDPVTGYVLLDSYPAVPAITVETKYHIENIATLPMANRDWSRIFDSDDVFPGYCSDGVSFTMNTKFDEFFTFLDDASDGIKIVFFNKDTLNIEEHLFSGPVFESYSVADDELGSPDNFPNALVKINNPIHLTNPLSYSGDYGFLNDKVVRFRKKTFKELLPSKTFRTIELMEMMPL